MEQWPHLNELVQCYKTDWIKDENKYGHYESVGNVSFQNQIFEGPDTDIETGIVTYAKIYGCEGDNLYHVNHKACGVAVRPVGDVDGIPFNPGSNPFVRILWPGLVSDGRIFSFKLPRM